MNDEKSSFLKVMEMVGSATSGENAIAAELQKHTENFVLDLSDADQYHTQITDLSQKIDAEISKVASITTTNTNENNIKIAALDYLKNTQRMLENLSIVCSTANGDTQQIKEYILYNLDGFFVTRDSSFEGLRSLSLAEAQNLGIKATSDTEKIMLNIQK